MTSRRSPSFPYEPKLWAWSDQTHLLHEDFSNLIVPYPRKPAAYELSTEGIPYYQVGESLTLGERAQHVDGFVRAAASGLLVNHNVWLEVVFDDGAQQSCTVCRFRSPWDETRQDGRSGSASYRAVKSCPTGSNRQISGRRRPHSTRIGWCMSRCPMRIPASSSAASSS